MPRPICVDELVAGLDGSAEAKERVALLLKTFPQMKQFQEAAEAINVSTQYLSELRKQILQAAVTAVESKPLGRPAQEPTEADLLKERISQLEQRIRDLTVEKEIGHLREELIAAGMSGKLKRLQKKHR